MLARTSSPGGARPGSRRHNNANALVHNPLNFSVQDRRLNTRLLKETQRRKAQLLGMTRHDVARQLHRYTVPPSSIMDQGHRGGPSIGKSASHTNLATGGGKSTSRTGADAASAVSFPLGIHSEAGESSSSSRDSYSRLQEQYAQRLQKKKDTVNYSLNSPTSPGEDDERTDSVPPVPPTASYEEWLSAGCPTGSWSVLLQEEVYAPLEAERAFLIAKYNPEERLQS
ncbi:conserved hypothetical protein [Leishmania major strain Friedlin]|uniref:Uncharacterized protein n=1 Tax=Leishmania major TaxID=5664 RepID=E9ADS5_LEIMA|nr:conserved hypothetical protein [Leishmania major strain Friedlin]CAG9577802.1 hypothetical_protein_-_conserved [Leishmania major strain Friedlin]CBZ12404.1 conserved hypothetical protein [Leishmania major strain Friedlin]|eukprot:XP_003722147.1 conserved hypothetical protein [Leishmania major strain Friedlin]